jgi:predicted secreted Zn-dependent protease
MNSIKNDLKEIILNTMIPESEAFLEELHTGYNNSNITQEDQEAIEDMESFLVELKNILLAIEKDKISDDEAKDVYERILALINEHEEDTH